MNDYARLVDEAERPPKRVVDHREAWERLTPLLGLNGITRERVQAFAETKRISLEALIALGTRIKVDAHGGVELGWGYQTRENGVISALKFRPLGDKQRYALAPSVFLELLGLRHKPAQAPSRRLATKPQRPHGLVLRRPSLRASASTTRIPRRRRLRAGSTGRGCRNAGGRS
jgi:hypothetical protein